MSTQAIAYLRVSGKSQIDGDGFPRQQAAVEGLAMKIGATVVRTIREEAVSGTTVWGERPAFMEMVALIEENPNLRTVIVENLSRLAREYTVQEGILLFLASRKIDLYSADTGENITEAVRNDPMKKAMIQIQASFFELEKSNLVNKLRAARERKKAETGRCEGQRPFGTGNLEEEHTFRVMIRLREEGLGMRGIAAELNRMGRATRNGRAWHFSSVSKILARVELAEEVLLIADEDPGYQEANYQETRAKVFGTPTIFKA